MILKIFLTFLLSSLTLAKINDSLSAENNFLVDSTFSSYDSLSVSDSIAVARPDSIAPINAAILSDKSFLVTNKEISRLEYRYTGDYLRLFSFNFIKDLGFPGQPNETFLYGVGNSAVSYLMDGISYNQRQDNSLNLNLIQSEDIDSIEVLPLPRGFLYGAYNNPVSVNFITKDFLPLQPYSRIRYYQGSNRESLIDGLFNIRVTKKIITSFELTNRIVDSTYANTEYSIWQGKVKLKYLLSNSVNLIASYNFNNYKAGYSGGVDVDSIKSVTSDVESVLYDYNRAPVVYPNGELKTKTNLARLRILAEPFDWLNIDGSVFYYLNKFEQNAINRLSTEGETYGLNLFNNAKYKWLSLKFNIDYEKRNVNSKRTFVNSPEDWQNGEVVKDYSADIFSVAFIASADLINGAFVPSVYYKTSSYNLNFSQPLTAEEKYNSQGVGLDLNVKTNLNIDFYAGASVFKPYKVEDFDYSLLEVGVRYKNDFIFSGLKYFINEYSYGFYTGGMFFDYISYGDLSGVGIDLKLNYWKLLLESFSSFYSNANNKLSSVPDFQTQTGLYFKSKLFNDNLDLKTGFLFYYVGKNNVYTNEHGFLEVPSSYKLDFTLAGEIQKTAIVYFLWQNLFENEYYLTPYYPMPTRNIRFGIAWELFN